MRIAYYNPALAEPWGAGVHGRALVRAWRALGHVVLELPGHAANECRKRAEGGYPWAGRPGVVIGRDLKRRACARHHLPAMIARLEDFNAEVGVYRRLDHDHLADGIVRRLQIPYVAEVNAVASIERRRLYGRRSLPGEESRERRYLERARRVVCAASDIAAEVDELGARPREMVVVHNGVDTGLFRPDVPPDPRAAVFRSRFRAVVGYCATSSAVHDLGTLSMATAILAESHRGVGFIFIGPEPAAMRARLARAGVDDARVFCTGAVEHAAVPGILVTADVLWAAINKETNQSLKVYEYMAMGKPVAMASSGQEPSPLAEAAAGLVVPRGDADGLASAVASMLADSAASNRFGRNGRAWVRRNATWEVTAARMIEGIVE